MDSLLQGQKNPLGLLGHSPLLVSTRPFGAQPSVGLY